MVLVSFFGALNGIDRGAHSFYLSPEEALTMFALIEGGEDGEINSFAKITEGKLELENYKGPVHSLIQLILSDFPQYRLEEVAKEMAE